MKIKNCNHILNKVICQLVLIFCISVTASANSNWESFVKDIKAKSNTSDADSKGILSSFIEMDGVGGTYNEAFDLATDSSGKNSFYGHYSLGKLLKNGRGVSQNSKKANEFFNKSVPLILKEAENGNPVCQYLAAECYNYGHGVDLNPKKAEKWSMKSIDRGFLASYHQLAIAYMNQEKSDEYLSNLKKSAEYGFAASQLALYSANQIFAESKSELEEAKEWFQKAIKQNCASLRKPASSEIASNSTKPIKAEEKAHNQEQTSSDVNRNSNEANENGSSNTAKENTGIITDIVKVEATDQQTSYLETKLKFWSDNSIFEELLSQNKREGWGPDAESIIFVKAIKRNINDEAKGENIPFGSSYLWWPDKNLISIIDCEYPTICLTICHSEISGLNLFNIVNAHPSSLYHGPLSRIDVKYIKPNYEYAINKCIDWYNTLINNNAADSSFVKEIFLVNGSPSGYAMCYEGDHNISLMVDADEKLDATYSERTGWYQSNGKRYFLDGKGFKRFARCKSKDLPNIIYPIKCIQYQYNLIKKYHLEGMKAEKNKKDIINSLQ